MRLDGKVALITGGASGLGFETAKQFVEAGAQVAMADLNEERGAQAEKELDGKGIFIKLDVSNQDECKKAIEAVVEHFGAIHILVNSAGIATASMTLSSKGTLDFAKFRKTIEVNLYGTAYCAAYAAFHMSKNDPIGDKKERGVIINVSSVAAFEG